jgi:hypothetical protein
MPSLVVSVKNLVQGFLDNCVERIVVFKIYVAAHWFTLFVNIHLLEPAEPSISDSDLLHSGGRIIMSLLERMSFGYSPFYPL